MQISLSKLLFLKEIAVCNASTQTYVFSDKKKYFI